MYTDSTTTNIAGATREEKKKYMPSAVFIDAVEVLLDEKKRNNLQKGEGHIVIETEENDDSFQIMMSCASSLSSSNKVTILVSLIQELEFEPLDVLRLMIEARKFVENPKPRNPFEELFGL